ncbi:MAG: flavodoxin domain-containing protein [Candidatus Omnitrophica bacterium]|nr:flavodoxin domain-containing protein [Candidatus Omnitrophota bacterium]
MKIIIIYFSLTGNTKKVAEKIYKILKTKGIEVSSFRLPSGEKKSFLRQCFEALVGKTYHIEKTPQIENYNVVFIGSPVWAGKITPIVNSFLKECNLSNKNVFLFTTYGSGFAKSNAMKKFEEIVKEKGGNLIGKIEIQGKKVEQSEDKIKEELEKCLKEL